MMNWDNKTTEKLIEALLVLRTKKEARRFLRDLLTPQEIIEFGKRWQAARMLDEKRPYSEIVQKTGLSSTTVARVSQWLNRGMGGYKLMIGRLSGAPHHDQALMRRE